MKYGGKARVGFSTCVILGSPLLRRVTLGMQSAQTYFLDVSKASPLRRNCAGWVYRKKNVPLLFALQSLSGKHLLRHRK